MKEPIAFWRVKNIDRVQRSKLSLLTHLSRSCSRQEDVLEASCLSVQGLRKCLEENVQTCASIVPGQTMPVPVLLLQRHWWHSQSPCQTEMCVWSARFGRNNELKERRKEKQRLAGCGEELLLERESGFGSWLSGMKAKVSISTGKELKGEWRILVSLRF